jgi:hypothetical protein
VRAALVPGVLALLPEYAGLEDPVAELRAACLEAVKWLAEAGPVVVVGDPQGQRVGRALLVAAGGFETVAAQPPQPPAAAGAVQPAQPPAAAGAAQPARPPQPPAAAYLVVANGSARRSEKAPGHLDERAAAFDDALRAALLAGDVSGVDLALGAELLASLDGIGSLGGILEPGCRGRIDYDADPYGVQYWVMRWEW